MGKRRLNTSKRASPESLLTAIRERASKGQSTGRWGIGLASFYLQRAQDAGADPCKLLDVSPSQWAEALKNAEATPTYCEEDATIDEVVVSSFTEEERDLLTKAVELRAVKKLAGTELEAVKDACMVFDCTLTTADEDRDGDILLPEGAEVDLKGPLLVNHVPLQPIGRLVKVLSQDSKALREREAILDFPLGRDCAKLIEFGAMSRMSHGFLPKEFEPRKWQKGSAHPHGTDDFPGWLVRSYEVLERSCVSIPSNRQALIEGWALLGEKAFQTTGVKSWVKSLYDCRPKVFRAAVAPSQPPADTIRWNKSLSPLFDANQTSAESFDPSTEFLPPGRTLYDWVSKFLECSVSEIYENGTSFRGAMMGNCLHALRNALTPYPVRALRNLDGNAEVPPVYETIQLNSRQRDDFLVCGTTFHEGGFVIDLQPTYYGIRCTVFTRRADAAANRGLLDTVANLARENNFLKGEAFELSGEFLPNTGESWEDVFLTPHNEKVLRRSVEVLNKRGGAMNNRGILLMGPPGSGKTLSGRIIRNLANATFIWVAARDFHYGGSFGTMSQAFEMAKDLSPSVIFLEDVDNWLHDTSVDYLKSEMDGIGRSAGVLTILTTNFPERMPEALIDRPGRFHDVLKVDLPDAKCRRAMLAKWMPEIVNTDAMEDLIRRTDGMSGAHVRELTYLARMYAEEDGDDAAKAALKAIGKIEEQRELITDVQLGGSRFRPRKEVARFLTKSAGSTEQSSPCEIHTPHVALIEWGELAETDEIAPGVRAENLSHGGVRQYLFDSEEFTPYAAQKWLSDRRIEPAKFDVGWVRETEEVATVARNVGAALGGKETRSAAGPGGTEMDVKAGRVLSAENEGKLKSACDHLWHAKECKELYPVHRTLINKAHGCVKEVLDVSRVTTDADEGAEKSAAFLEQEAAFKAGRILSSANEKKLRTAIDHCEKCMSTKELYHVAHTLVKSAHGDISHVIGKVTPPKANEAVDDPKPGTSDGTGGRAEDYTGANEQKSLLPASDVMEGSPSPGESHSSADNKPKGKVETSGCDLCAPGCPCATQRPNGGQKVCPPGCTDCTNDCPCKTRNTEAAEPKSTAAETKSDLALSPEDKRRALAYLMGDDEEFADKCLQVIQAGRDQRTRDAEQAVLESLFV